MKQYPSISAEISNISCYVFNKLDGSNIRAEWTSKNGFYKFGTRHRLLGEDEPVIGKAISIIKSKYSNLTQILKQSRTQRAICFFEFWGPNSAFGQHDKNEEQTVTLIDVDFYKKGILPPKEFLDMFAEIDHASLLYHGSINCEFIESIRNGTLPGIGNEGVVCKGPFDRKLGSPIMFKIKRNDWYERLKEYCKGNKKLFEELK
jgi:hypothetical protein